MELEGIHHITAITGDSRLNVEFYVRVLGLRMVKKTVNQDDPTVYHLFYGDEDGSPGMDLTFFEYPGSPPGRAGAGMVYRIVWRVGSTETLDFWEERLAGMEVVTIRDGDSLRFSDPEGLEHELTVVDVPDPPLRAPPHVEIPAEHGLQGFEGVRAYSAHPENSEPLLTGALGFGKTGADTWEARGEERGGWIAYDEPPEQRGLQGGGSVHHVAWAAHMGDSEGWIDRVKQGGAHPTQVIDRFYFLSVYFREPSGVLFEIATIGPGFATDEPADHLGEKLSLPPDFEQLRDRVEPRLTPLPDVTQWRG
jgi:glyoxalase family protein